MTKVTIKTGDTRLTSMGGKARVFKSDSRLARLRAIDEAASILGLAHSSYLLPAISFLIKRRKE